jgi:hypothetical protein
MSAFDKLKKQKYMPSELWGIFDNQTSMWCSRYSINPNFVQWSSSVGQAELFTAKSEADTKIAAWPGGDQGGRFIGKNPPPH